jgi:hypothetical protein
MRISEFPITRMQPTVKLICPGSGISAVIFEPHTNRSLVHSCTVGPVRRERYARQLEAVSFFGILNVLESLGLSKMLTGRVRTGCA